MKFPDYIAFLVLIFQYVGYHAFYIYISKRKNWVTRDKIIGGYREKWLQVIIQDENPLIAIQTIRNLTMTNTFLISISMILSGGLFSVFSVQLDWLQVLEKGQYLQFLDHHPVAIKILVALIFLITSATNFLFSLRVLYNMNFTMSSSHLASATGLQLEQLERHNKYFIIGLRALYFFIGPMLWIIDPIAMIIFSSIATFLFVRFDFIKAERT